MGIHEDSGEMNFGSFLQPKSLQLKLDQIISQVQEIKITQTLHSESINRFSEKQASMRESIFKIQESLSESKVDEKVGTKVLALLETNLKSVETTLKSFETTLREIMVDLTAVKGAAVAQKAELLKVVADTHLQAALGISKEFRNFFYRTIVVVSCPDSFLRLIYNNSFVGRLSNYGQHRGNSQLGGA